MKLKSLPVFFCSFFLLYTACTKISSTDIGTGLIPAVDGVNTKDTTITVNAKNSGDSTISPLITDAHVVGNVEDPLFGTTDARINFQLSLPSTSFHFENTSANLFLDSVVLVLSYNGIWGDSTRPVSLRVNEIDPDQPFIPDTTSFDAYGYKATYNNTSNFIAPTSLTDIPATIDPRTLGDTFRAFRDSGINMIRIKLSDAFGRRLLSYDSAVVYKNDSVFKTYLKGLQVYADAGGNSLLKVGLTDVNTKLALYYKYHPVDSAAEKRDTAVTYFTVNSLTSAHSNHIVRTRSTGQINNYLPSNPAIPNDDLIFVQAGPGTYATVTVQPGALANMPNIIVHRAELLMEQADDPSDLYNTPPYLFLLAKNDTSRFVIPGFDSASLATADAIFSSSYLSNYVEFGGVPSKNTSNNSLYSFNISRYVQGVVSKHQKEYPLIVYAPYNEPLQLLPSVPYTTARGYVTSSPVNAAGCGRVRLYGGGDNTAHRMRLHIVYSIPH